MFSRVPPRFPSRRDWQSHLWGLKTLRRSYLGGRKGHEFKMGLFKVEKPKRHKENSRVARHMGLELGPLKRELMQMILIKVISVWYLKPWKLMQYFHKKGKRQIRGDTWTKPQRTPTFKEQMGRRDLQPESEKRWLEMLVGHQESPVWSNTLEGFKKEQVVNCVLQ